MFGAVSFGGRIWDALDHSHTLETWLKSNASTIPGQIVEQLVANGWLFLFLGLVLWWHDSRIERPPVTEDSGIATSRLDFDQVRRERDGLRLENAGLVSVVTERDGQILALTKERNEARRLLGFPEFQVTILEVLACDPVEGPDLFGALIVQIANGGAPSVARSYEVFAHTVFGATIEVEISAPPVFTLYLNGGRDYVAYEPQHYLMTRAYDKPIQRGVPVTGVIPCVFRSITSLKEIDMRSLKVTLCDGTGTTENTQQLWHSTPLMGGLNFNETVPQRVRINLPTIQPRPIR